MRLRQLPPGKKYTDRPPWAHNFDNVQTRTVDAAWNALLTRDLTQISYRELAKEVGVTTPAIYHHFPTIHALGETLAIAAGWTLRDEMIKKTQRHQNARACFKAYLRFAARRPHHLALMLAPQHREAELILDSRDRFLDDFRALLGFDAGRKSVGASETRALWMALHGAAVMVAAGIATEREAFDDIKPLLDRLTGRSGRPPRTASKRARAARKS